MKKKILIEQKGQAKDSAVAEDIATNRAEGIRRIIPENFENMAELNSLQESRVSIVFVVCSDLPSISKRPCATGVMMSSFSSSGKSCNTELLQKYPSRAICA